MVISWYQDANKNRNLLAGEGWKVACFPPLGPKRWLKSLRGSVWFPLGGMPSTGGPFTISGLYLAFAPSSIAILPHSLPSSVFLLIADRIFFSQFAGSVPCCSSARLQVRFRRKWRERVPLPDAQWQETRGRRISGGRGFGFLASSCQREPTWQASRTEFLI